MKRLSAILPIILLVAMTAAPALSVSAQSIPNNIEDNGIPIMNITIDESAEGYGTIKEMNSSPDHSVECTGTVKITVPDGYTGDYSEAPLSDTKELKLDYIRGRGNTTWFDDKKPYKLKLDKKNDLLGMGKNKHWVLLANYKDATLLRNRIISYIGSEVGLAYTPKMLPVDVVMNGEYLGSYYLSEQVRVGENRVDIDELTDEDNSEPEITGGYLIGMNPYAEEPELNCFNTDMGVRFMFDTPAFASDDPTDEVGTAEQKAYITNYLQKVEDSIYSGDPGKYMDLQSTADYWWVQTFSYNYDAYFTDSTYLYKPRNDKLYWGPLWDFDLSMGRSFSRTEGYSIRETPWFDYLRENNADFRQLLIDRWQVLNNIITDIVKDGGVLDGYKAEIKNSWEDNAPFSENQDADFDAEMENLRSWLTDRQDWINANLDLIGKVHSTVTFKADGETFGQRQVLTGLPLSNLPQAPEKDGYVFTGWECEGEPINLNDPPEIWDDTVITAQYLGEDEVIHADHIFFSGYDIWADMSWFDQYYTSYTVTPVDAQDKNVTWSSSDRDIAEVDQDGVVTMKQVGEVTITAALRSGFSKSYTLHIYDGDITQLNEPESITLEQSTITMKVGEYAQVVASASPQPCETYFNYLNDDSDIIEIFGDGVIRALAPGTTTVTVCLNDLEAVCTIIVTDGEEAAEKPTEAPTEAATVSDPTTPTQAATEAKSSTTGGSTSVSGGAVATGENTVVPIVFILIIAAAGIVLYYYSYRERKIK